MRYTILIIVASLIGCATMQSLKKRDDEKDILKQMRKENVQLKEELSRAEDVVDEMNTRLMDANTPDVEKMRLREDVVAKQNEVAVLKDAVDKAKADRDMQKSKIEELDDVIKKERLASAGSWMQKLAPIANDIPGGGALVGLALSMFGGALAKKYQKVQPV